MRFILVFFTLLLSIASARANDSMAEVALGGLTLLQSDAISLDSEDLYISQDEVRVNYRFTNTSNKDVSALVAFPLPDQIVTEQQEGWLRDYAAELAFTTRVDGVAMKLDVVHQAFLKDATGEKDVTARIKEAGLSLFTGDGLLEDAIKTFTKEKLAALTTEGILVNSGDEANPYYMAGWNIRSSVTRQQVFPAGKTVAVEHRYKPISGGSVGGNLSIRYRNEDWAKEHTAQFCIEDSFYNALDKQVAQRASGNVSDPYTEIWLGYVLKSGANWKGPIKDFRLVIDKGKPENLVSFCGEGVKKIAPTQFEVRKTNFEPKDDLRILVVEWYDPVP